MVLLLSVPGVRLNDLVQNSHRILGQRASLKDLQTQVKQAHWNVKGLATIRTVPEVGRIQVQDLVPVKGVEFESRADQLKLGRR
jgi:hypothetical protein